ncbi:MAG: hypothetical protein U0528_17195 [Anaerolineae bacterium]
MFSFAVPILAQPDALIVDTTSDSDLRGCLNAVPNDCSLRGAINLANSVAGDDTITFDPAVFSTPQIINLTTTLPLLTTNMVIDGPGANLLTVRRDNSGSYRIFAIFTSSTVSIDGLTIANGNLGQGSGILNQGTLTLTNSTVSGNTATGTIGGGIRNDGTLTVIDTTVSGNSALFGGGIYSNGTLIVSRSTFNSNTASDSNNSGNGGGIFVNQGTATVSNSTFSGNSALSTGGGIFNGGALTVYNSTLYNNLASSGGNVMQFAGTVTLRNTIVANGTAWARSPMVATILLILMRAAAFPPALAVTRYLDHFKITVDQPSPIYRERVVRRR